MVLGIFSLAVFHYMFVQLPTSNLEPRSIVYWLAGAVLVGGEFIVMHHAYYRKWPAWGPRKKARTFTLALALILLFLAASNVITVWTAGMNYAQGLIGSNYIAFEGIDFRNS